MFDVSGSLCVENAIRIANIFDYYQERFDMKQIFMTGLQHAGTAATALMGDIDLSENDSKQRALLDHLSRLENSIKLMSKSYHASSSMLRVTGQFFEKHRMGRRGIPTSTRSDQMSRTNAEGNPRLRELGNGEMGDPYSADRAQLGAPPTTSLWPDSFGSKNEGFFCSPPLPTLPWSWAEDPSWNPDPSLMSLMDLEDLASFHQN